MKQDMGPISVNSPTCKKHFPLSVITSYSKHQQRHKLFSESTINEKPCKLLTSTVEILLILRHEPIHNTSMFLYEYLGHVIFKIDKIYIFKYIVSLHN